MNLIIFVISIAYEVFEVSRIHYLVTIDTNPFHVRSTSRAQSLVIKTLDIVHVDITLF